MTNNSFLNIAYERAQLSGAALNGYVPKKLSKKLLKKDLELLDKISALYVAQQMVIAATRYLIRETMDTKITSQAIKHRRKKLAKKPGR